MSLKVHIFQYDEYSSTMRMSFRGLCGDALGDGAQELGVFRCDILWLPGEVVEVLFEEVCVPCAAEQIFAAGVGMDAVESEVPFLRLGVLFPIISFDEGAVVLRQIGMDGILVVEIRIGGDVFDWLFLEGRPEGFSRGDHGGVVFFGESLVGGAALLIHQLSGEIVLLGAEKTEVVRTVGPCAVDVDFRLGGELLDERDDVVGVGLPEFGLVGLVGDGLDGDDVPFFGGEIVAEAHGLAFVAVRLVFGIGFGFEMFLPMAFEGASADGGVAKHGRGLAMLFDDFAEMAMCVDGEGVADGEKLQGGDRFVRDGGDAENHNERQEFFHFSVPRLYYR